MNPQETITQGSSLFASTAPPISDLALNPDGTWLIRVGWVASLTTTEMDKSGVAAEWNSNCQYYRICTADRDAEYEMLEHLLSSVMMTTKRILFKTTADMDYALARGEIDITGRTVRTDKAQMIKAIPSIPMITERPLIITRSPPTDINAYNLEEIYNYKTWVMILGVILVTVLVETLARNAIAGVMSDYTRRRPMSAARRWHSKTVVASGKLIVVLGLFMIAILLNTYANILAILQTGPIRPQFQVTSITQLAKALANGDCSVSTFPEVYQDFQEIFPVNKRRYRPNSVAGSISGIDDYRSRDLSDMHFHDNRTSALNDLMEHEVHLHDDADPTGSSQVESYSTKCSAIVDYSSNALFYTLTSRNIVLIDDQQNSPEISFVYLYRHTLPMRFRQLLDVAFAAGSADLFYNRIRRKRYLATHKSHYEQSSEAQREKYNTKGYYPRVGLPPPLNLYEMQESFIIPLLGLVLAIIFFASEWLVGRHALPLITKWCW